jgi:hypothetical protein
MEIMARFMYSLTIQVAQKYCVFFVRLMLMPLISFECRLCKRRFSKRLDYVPDGAVIVDTCPFCRQRIELTSGDAVDGGAVEIIALDAVRQAKR